MTKMMSMSLKEKKTFSIFLQNLKGALVCSIRDLSPTNFTQTMTLG